MWIGFFHDRTAGGMLLTKIGALKTVPSNAALNGAVGAAPFFLEIVFFHAVFVRGDGGAFDADTVFLYGFCRFEGYFVVCFVPFFELQVIICKVHVQIG